MPVIIVIQGSQYRESRGDKALDIVIKKFAINSQAAVFDVLWFAVFIRMTYPGCKLALDLFKTGHDSMGKLIQPQIVGVTAAMPCPAGQ